MSSPLRAPCGVFIDPAIYGHHIRACGDCSARCAPQADPRVWVCSAFTSADTYCTPEAAHGDGCRWEDAFCGPSLSLDQFTLCYRVDATALRDAAGWLRSASLNALDAAVLSPTAANVAAVERRAKVIQHLDSLAAAVEGDGQ